jgi:uncharacterized membrane protein YeaQ/YmgE (transglycosylase-associated protein family)
MTGARTGDTPLWWLCLAPGRSRCRSDQSREKPCRTVATVTSDVTLNTLTLVLVAGALTGVITGQLLQRRGLRMLGDVLVGLVSTFLGVVVLGTLLATGHFGFVGSLLLAIAGAIVTVVLAHLALLVRQLATAS